MTTINYTADHSVKGGYVRVQWPGLVNGDDGQPFDSAGSLDIALLFLDRR